MKRSYQRKRKWNLLESQREIGLKYGCGYVYGWTLKFLKKKRR
jgi:hypothetical protein